MAVAGVVLALVGDRLFGEVSRGHPLVTFGQWASELEVRARRWAGPAPGDSPNCERRLQWAGALAWAVLVMVPTLLLVLLLALLGDFLGFVLSVVVLYFSIGMRSLAEHARAVALPLDSGDLDTARAQLGRLVSRDTAALDAQAVAGATIESVLENGSDAVLAPIFWFAVAGAPGVLCHRLANTLDAMWGYRNSRYLHFGWAAARIDDLLNWVPARGCALAYALAGDRLRAMRCWRVQAIRWDSPNAGPVMAAGAGALGIRLGGAAVYHGEHRDRPDLGEGAPAVSADIERALALLWCATLLWILGLILWGLLF